MTLSQVRKFLASYKSPPELEILVKRLKGQLASFEKYQGDPDMVYALGNLRTIMIPNTLSEIEAKL